MSRRPKALKEFRDEIVAQLRWEAGITDSMGDSEGAGRLRDIARDISRKRLTVDIREMGNWPLPQRFNQGMIPPKG